ncbi:MAG TPA: HEAT repeat domain-containing protein [Stellaceae bacterium]|nr:HEAT repeat domain-containing protein [Stellaceae bacterium]
MDEQQLDLFADAGCRVAPFQSSRPDLPAAELDNDALIAAIPSANLAVGTALAAEAARRRLVAAIPALEALCRRFSGFGVERLVPEQVAALEALAAIGGGESARVVARSIARGVVQGPTLAVALGAAATLGGALSAEILRPLLGHANPAIRAEACRCAGSRFALAADLVARLEDRDARVARAAACTLGQMGRAEARPLLLALLRKEPSVAVIEAVSPVADEECLVLLGRIARTMPALASAALDALDGIEEPRAHVIAAAARRQRPPPTIADCRD